MRNFDEPAEMVEDLFCLVALNGLLRSLRRMGPQITQAAFPQVPHETGLSSIWRMAGRVLAGQDICDVKDQRSAAVWTLRAIKRVAPGLAAEIGIRMGAAG